VTVWLAGSYLLNIDPTISATTEITTQSVMIATAIQSDREPNLRLLASPACSADVGARPLMRMTPPHVVQAILSAAVNRST
jgi:hypothetical protein